MAEALLVCKEKEGEREKGERQVSVQMLSSPIEELSPDVEFSNRREYLDWYSFVRIFVAQD